MNRWWVRILVAICCFPLVPKVIDFIAGTVARLVNKIAISAQDIFHPLSQSGEAGFLGAIRLCLYLLAIIILVRFMTRRGD